MAVDTLSVIYNVGAVFAGPSLATGYMFSSGTSGDNLLQQIPRVQSAGITLNIPRTDVNQLGQLARLDNVMTDAPSASVNLEYLALDGKAESMLGFTANDLNTTFISGFLSRATADRNIFLVQSPEGSDAIGYVNGANSRVFAIGNGYVSNYSLSAAVGQLVRATVAIDGVTYASYTSGTNLASPAIDFNTDAPVSGPTFSIPTAISYTGADIPSALRPAECVLSIANDSSLGDYTSGVGKIHINSYNLSVPLNTQTITELGHMYGAGKKLVPPFPFTVSIDATAADVAASSLATLRCNDTLKNLRLTLNQPNCGGGTGVASMIVDTKGVKLTSRDFSLGIGGPATVRLTFEGQVGGIGDSTRGVFMSGNYGAYTGS